MSESETEKKLITIRATIARIRVFLQQEGGDIELDSFGLGGWSAHQLRSPHGFLHHQRHPCHRSSRRRR